MATTLKHQKDVENKVRKKKDQQLFWISFIDTSPLEFINASLSLSLSPKLNKKSLKLPLRLQLFLSPLNDQKMAFDSL